MTIHASIEQLSSYLDAELAKRERAELEDHLKDCPSCRRRLDGLSGVAARLGRLERQAPPPHLAFLVERRVAAERDRGSLRQRLEEGARTLSLQSWLMPVFGLVVALTLILYLFSFGVARQEATGTRVIVPSTEEVVPEISMQVVGGRSFRWVEGIWIEVGLPAESRPEEVLDFTGRSAPPELARFSVLGERVRLLRDGRAVELVFD